MSDKNHMPATFVGLALALASDYDRLFVINAEDDSYKEYSAVGSDKELIEVASGESFFKDVRRDCREQVWPADQDYFLNAFKKENVVEILKDGKSFSLTYRLTDENGVPRYYYLKTIRGNDQSVVIGVQDIDEQMHREAMSKTYSDIANALAGKYEVIYYVDINNNEYIQYNPSEEYSKLGLTVRGTDFFSDSAKDIKKYIHPADIKPVLTMLQKDNILESLKKNGSLSFNYRQMLDGRYQYVNTTVVFPKNDIDHIVVGVANTDDQVRREQMMEAENLTFSNISMALAQRYEVIYHVNVVTNEYSEYTASEKYAKLRIGTTGKDFFAESLENMKSDIYAEDLPMMQDAMKKDNLMQTLLKYGKTFLNYRLIIDGEPQYVSLYAVRPQEDSEHIIVAVANVDASKKMELAYKDAMDMASRDALTGVKNKRSYAQTEIQIDNSISSGDKPEFSVVVCDLNCLKQTNDKYGHNAGDEFIRESCKIICDVFSHSPVFRVGGDEFAVILRDSDYERRYELLINLDKILSENKRDGIKPIAVGMSDYYADKDIRVQDVFERADAQMYKDKRMCKAAL